LPPWCWSSPSSSIRPPATPTCRLAGSPRSAQGGSLLLESEHGVLGCFDCRCWWLLLSCRWLTRGCGTTCTSTASGSWRRGSRTLSRRCLFRRHREPSESSDYPPSPSIQEFTSRPRSASPTMIRRFGWRSCPMTYRRLTKTACFTTMRGASWFRVTGRRPVVEEGAPQRPRYQGITWRMLSRLTHSRANALTRLPSGNHLPSAVASPTAHRIALPGDSMSRYRPWAWKSNRP